MKKGRYQDWFFIFLIMGIVFPILTLNILTGLPFLDFGSNMFAQELAVLQYAYYVN